MRANTEAQNQVKRLKKELDCAEEIIRAFRDRSLLKFRSGKHVRVFLARPLGVHGGVVMIEQYCNREYRYLEEALSIYRDLVAHGAKDAVPVNEALEAALAKRRELYT